MAYTLEQLKTMGASPNPSPAPGGSYTVDQLQQMGARPVAAEPKKKRGIIGKVAEFLAPTAVHTVEKLAAGEKIGFRDVAGSALEVGSFFIPVGAAAKGATLAAKGVGLAGKAAARQAAQKTAVRLGTRVAQFAKGGAISGGMAAGGRSVGEGGSVSDVLAQTAAGATLGAATGAALPIAGAGVSKIAKSFAGRAAKKAGQEALLKSGAADARIAKQMIRGGKVVPDDLAKEAVKQGVEEADVSFFKTMTKKDAAKGLGQLDIRENQLRNRRELRRAMDVAGDTFIEKVAKPIQQLNKKAGQNLEVVAEKLKGQRVDPTSAIRDLSANLEKAGVTLDRRGRLSFKDSIFDGQKLRPIQTLLNDMWARAQKVAKTGDAMLMHRTKRYIDELVEYGAEGEGLSGNAERIVKSFRKNLDSVLDTNFKSYNQANTVFADTVRQLNDMGSVIGKRFRLGEEFADSRAGLGLRRVLSNTQSRAEVLRLMHGIQEIAKKYKINIDEDAISQAQFADILERIIGSEAPASIMGQTEKAVGIGARAVTSPVRAGIELAKHGIEAVRGVNQENKIKAIREILKRIAGEAEPPAPTRSAIGRPRLPKTSR